MVNYYSVYLSECLVDGYQVFADLCIILSKLNHYFIANWLLFETEIRLDPTSSITSKAMLAFPNCDRTQSCFGSVPKANY